jgi:hypothetical protein
MHVSTRLISIGWGTGGEDMDGGQKHDRRQLLKIFTIGGVATALVLPTRWTKPLIKSVIVPAHAQASPGGGGGGDGGEEPTTTPGPTTTDGEGDDGPGTPGPTTTDDGEGDPTTPGPTTLGPTTTPIG